MLEKLEQRETIQPLLVIGQQNPRTTKARDGRVRRARAPTEYAGDIFVCTVFAAVQDARYGYIVLMHNVLRVCVRYL
jgi:hypothetical protein